MIARYSTVLYPVDILMLLSILPAKGWVVPEIIREGDGGITLERRPAKGGIRLSFDIGNKTLGAEGEDPAELTERFREVLDAANEVGDADILREIAYVELRCIGAAKGSRTPVQVLGQFWTGASNVEAFGKLVSDRFPTKQVLGPYGVRIAPMESPNQPEWTEIALSPVAGAAPTWYHFDVIYRRKEMDPVETACQNLDQSLRRIFAELEK